MVKSIVSYNVNGIRAALNKGLAGWIRQEQPDILCFQEIKANENQIDKNVFDYLGYEQHYYPAMKKGYSGVAILTKDKPDQIMKGINIPEYDDEGRLIMAQFNDILLLNAYFPSGTTGDARQEFKMAWLEDFQRFTDKLKQSYRHIIICGDFNICHKEIDINHPERHHKTSGFLPEERAWMTSFLNSGFVDTFRVFNSKPEQYTWWSYRANARAKNLGWRIDYHVASLPLRERLVNSVIQPEAVHSDHCPIKLEIIF